MALTKGGVMNFAGKMLAALLLAGAAMSVSVAHAEDAKAADSKAVGSGPNPFTDCGIGAALFSETKWAAVTSNVIWDIGTTAVISATASPQTCSGKKMVAALFINDTYANLVEEAAKGQGEHLVTALNILGCDSSRQASAIQEIRGAMGQAVASPDYANQAHLEKASRFYSITDSVVSRTCGA
jgi:hypothetical protein